MAEGLDFRTYNNAIATKDNLRDTYTSAMANLPKDGAIIKISMRSDETEDRTKYINIISYNSKDNTYDVIEIDVFKRTDEENPYYFKVIAKNINTNYLCALGKALDVSTSDELSEIINNITPVIMGNKGEK